MTSVQEALRDIVLRTGCTASAFQRNGQTVAILDDRHHRQIVTGPDENQLAASIRQTFTTTNHEQQKGPPNELQRTIDAKSAAN